MYCANWVQMGYPLISLIQIPGACLVAHLSPTRLSLPHASIANPHHHAPTHPEYLNILGACLYISSSFYYNAADVPVVFGTNVTGTDTYLCQTVRGRVGGLRTTCPVARTYDPPW